MNAKGSSTYNNVIGRIRLRIKKFDDGLYPKLQIRHDIYSVMCELHELNGSANEPIYRDKDTIPVSKSVKNDGDATTLCSYTLATKTLYVPLTITDPTVTWYNDTDGFDSSWVGASVSLKDPSTGIVYADTIASVTDATHVVLTSTSIPGNMSGDGFVLSVTVSGSSDIVDISNLAAYKYLDKITSISDSVNGLLIEMPEKDFLAIKAYGTTDENPYAENIIWYRHGEIINFCRCNSAMRYGTRTMNYTRTPIKPTTYTEYVDFPDGQLELLMDAVCIKILRALKVELPTTLADVAATLKERRAAISEERAKLEENVKTSR